MDRDDTLFRMVFETHYDRLYLYALHLLRDEEKARDVVSGGFMHVWEHCESVVEATIAAYMQSMVRTRCIDLLRHEAVKREYQAEYLAAIDDAYKSTSEMEANARLVEDMLQALPPETEKILEMCYIERKKYREVSEILNIHPDTVKRHIMRALKFLRDNRKKFVLDL